MLPKPDVLIYLKASVPTLISQIKMRGREYEQNIDEEYLSRLNDKYNHWIENIYEGRVLVVDKDTDDDIYDYHIYIVFFIFINIYCSKVCFFKRNNFVVIF